MTKRISRESHFLQRLLRNEDGSPAVEFAIIAPLLVLLTAGMIDVGRLGLASSTLYLVADEGARYAAVHAEGSLLPKTEAEIEAFARKHIIGIEDSQVAIDMDWTPDPAISGGKVKVTATYTVDLWLTSFMNINDITMNRSATMTINY
jgi:Flp pilus assembly protein TadG